MTQVRSLVATLASPVVAGESILNSRAVLLILAASAYDAVRSFDRCQRGNRQ